MAISLRNIFWGKTAQTIYTGALLVGTWNGIKDTVKAHPQDQTALKDHWAEATGRSMYDSAAALGDVVYYAGKGVAWAANAGSAFVQHATTDPKPAPVHH